MYLPKQLHRVTHSSTTEGTAVRGKMLENLPDFAN